MPALRQEVPEYSYLSEKVLRHLTPAISAFFDYRDGEQCMRLQLRLRNFIAAACQQVDIVISDLVDAEADNKTREDWVSWYVEVFKVIQANTLSRFALLIEQSESLNLSSMNRIPCEIANRYIGKIGYCYKQVYNEYIQLTSISPMSRKHIKKRRSQKGRPYLLEFIPCGCPT
jgi:hypothetical protein